MKVISGKLKGRNIEGYNITGTRPTMDRVKESIFAMIQNSLPESIVLDLFSGSGNYGIEAISNGSKLAYFNDHNMKCIRIIKENLVNFDILNQSILLNYDYRECLKYLEKQSVQFNIVFLDPPYKEHIIENIMKELINKNLLLDKALIICESNEIIQFIHDSMILLKEKKYGNKKVFIYQYLKKNG